MSRRSDLNPKRKARNTVSRSKSNIATKRKQGLNLQTKRIDGKKVKLSTKELKTLSKKGSL